MNCPLCTTTKLVMAERQGIEIDYCPQCRGVWLDRGELDKIIERSTAAPSPADSRPQPAAPPYQAPQQAPYQAPYPPQGYRDDDDDDDHRRGGHPGGHYGQHKKKKGFLSELFDFD